MAGVIRENRSPLFFHCIGNEYWSQYIFLEDTCDREMYIRIIRSFVVYERLIPVPLSVIDNEYKRIRYQLIQIYTRYMKRENSTNMFFTIRCLSG